MSDTLPGSPDQLGLSRHHRLFSTMRGSGWPPLSSQGIVRVLSHGHPLPRMVLNNLCRNSKIGAPPIKTAKIHSLTLFIFPPCIQINFVSVMRTLREEVFVD